MFNITYSNPFYQVDQTVLKLIVLRHQHLEPDTEPTPEFIVFMAERGDNPGKSITNNIERIAGKVWGEFMAGLEISPKSICWVEVYPEVEPITVGLVYFKGFYEGGSEEPLIFTSPTWEPIKMNLEFLKYSLEGRGSE